MPIRSVTLRILGDSKDALDKMRLVNAEADKLEKRRVKVNVGVDIDNNDIVAVKAKIAALSKLRASIGVKLDTQGLLADFAKIKTELQALRVLTKDIKIDPGVDVRALTTATNELRKMGLAAGTTGASFRRLGQDTKDTGSIMGSIFTPGRSGFRSFFQFLTGDVKLFGGALKALPLLGTISTFHLLIDAIVEVGIVWTTAAIAAAAFGVAAIPTVDAIYNHMKNLVTVSKATGQNIYPLTGGFQRLAAAVKPQVYQIFGDALTVLNSRTGLFTKLATDAGSVLEHFAARIAVALRSGGGLSQFLDKAASNLSGLLESFASFFHIIGSLFSVMPGYAEILLAFGNAMLHVASVFVAAAKPIIGAGLWIHGFIVWAGLGVTVTWALGRALVWLGAKAIVSAITGFVSATIAAGTMAGSFSLAAAAAGAFDIAMTALGAVNPLVWVGVAVGAIAGLAFWMSKSKNVSQQWGDAMQKSIDNSSNLTQRFALTQKAALDASVRLGAARTTLSHINQYGANVDLHTGIAVRGVSDAYKTQSEVVAQARDQYNRFNREVEFNRTRMAALHSVYGQQTNVMALMNAAGITQAEWAQKGAIGFAILRQRIDATIAGYQAMGQSGGALNNDLAVMDRQVNSQQEAMQKLNQAWDQFIGDVTGNQSNFDSVAQGFHTLASNAAHASVSLGSARVPTVGLGKSIDGLTKSDIALNQAFTQQVGQLNTLFDSWRTAGVSNNLFTQGVKAGIQPLVRYARGSGEATAQLIALAQEAGYSGPSSLKQLVNWLGKGHNATQTLKKVTDQATIQEGLLTGAMDSQSKMIASHLLNELDLAILRYSKVSGAVNAYAKAIAEQGRQSDAARAARMRLIADLIDTERKAGLGKVAIAEMIHEITKIPLKVALQIVEQGIGKFSITGPGGKSVAGPGGRFTQGTTMAEGGRVTGGIPGKDSVLGMLMPGEVVVPTRLVNAGAIDHLRGMLPGFANGGQWPWSHRGLSPGGLGGAAVNYNKTFNADLTKSMESAMTSALKKAQQQALAVGLPGGHGAIGGGVQRWAGLVLQVLSMLGQPAGDLGVVLSQMTTESGGNPYAINLSDSNAAAGDPSRGLMQTIMSTFLAYAGPFRNRGIYDPLANIYAGINYAIHRYGAAWTSVLGHGHGYAEGTPGAAPGWAWVGERGPELVHMLGGERVIDALTSAKITRGYAGGTEGSRGASLINIFRNDQSDKSWRHDLHEYLRYINDYYNGRAKNWRDDHIRRQTRAMERAQDRLEKINQRASTYGTVRGAAFQNLSGYGDLSNIQLGPTTGVGDNVALSGGQGITIQLSQRLATLNQFSSALRKLVQLKLPNSLLQQIVAMGPDQGLQYAQAILSGGAQLIKTITQDETAITGAERRISRGVGAAAAGGGYRTSHDFIQGLRRQRHDLEDLFADLGRTLGREAVRWFHVPKSKRPKGFAAGGILTEPVWGIGASGTEYTFAENGPELISPKRLPHMGGGDTYIINVAGDSDPDGAARRIIQKVSDYKRRHGNVSTGIG